MKTYVVTGAGSGIGRAAAVILSREADVRILCVGRREDLIRETLSQMGPGDHRALALDCRDASAWRNALAGDPSQRDGISGVFANAGVGGENHYGEEDRWEEILSINLTGTYVTIMETLPLIRISADPFRHIVLTSSCLARFGVPHYTAYCTAKTGLLGLTRSLAVELAAEHILVNALCPGWVDTDMARSGIRMLADRAGATFEDELQRQKGYVPLGRLSQPEEIAALVAFLFSNRQTSMTGQAIDINNGSFMI
ncbi:MAG: SDR family NAD(P)-dependent oxidoreductase [Flavobacteriales bacterium]|jgi:NAD(P)-dependent dehydrogenase (short-subunit alcohol dehydrogenase family)